MNAVEIEAAVSELVSAPFDSAEFPYAFLAAFGNKETTLAKLRKGVSNSSDVRGGVLQRNNIHIAVAAKGDVIHAVTVLKESAKTALAKAKFILATDGEWFEAEDLISGEIVNDEYANLANYFGFFLPLAGISTVKEIKDNPIDVRATGRLNKLYVELLKENPEWARGERRPDLNHFLARIIFCFFAEDTDIFYGQYRFTALVERMTESDGSNTHEVLEQIFRAMNVRHKDRESANVPIYARGFPYVNGGLFSGSPETPRFSRITRSYLLRAGGLNWKEINPDIFGSMIQAVADDEERGALGMHYTSVPNILKVLNPLFLSELRDELEDAEQNQRRLFNLRNRLSKIRVFDPACGSGNFLVIAYKQMREIEAEINIRRGEIDRPTQIPLTNFRGIEMRDFAAEIARLALIIAEFQCDAKHRGPKLALAEFLPLNSENWVVCGNAMRLEWNSVCEPFGTGSNLVTTELDLFSTPLNQTKIEFSNEGGETYICSNPPYMGSTWQSKSQKADIEAVFAGTNVAWKSLDYVAGWFFKAVDYIKNGAGGAAFVSTNSICQGQQVPILWPLVFQTGVEIQFAYSSFKWANLASANAGVTVVIVGLSQNAKSPRRIFTDNTVAWCSNINAYLISGQNLVVEPVSRPIRLDRALMEWGNKPTDGGHLFLSAEERSRIVSSFPSSANYIRPFVGAKELIRGEQRYCLWIEDSERSEAEVIPEIAERIAAVAQFRSESKAAETRPAAAFPHRFRQIQSIAANHSIVVPGVSSEGREFLPCDLLPSDRIIGNKCFSLYDAPLWNMALIASRLHWVWIGTVCVRLEMRFSYSNTLGWNTFPVPPLTEQDKADLTKCAEEILLARERHFPKTIADLYDPDEMPYDLRHVHEKNDETLERIYIGRRFKNDTERLEKLFEMYAKMTGADSGKPRAKKRAQKA